ncbi:hypothetical protein M8C21_021701 [Ambrosia artemisiifolia]|uniref:DUF4378 domain-containing protein n=1 Tax=Ambrosia artemisiifolia TaxID=4212 RepID=A0AAD5C3X3_AMBAR|nr:hypothetical protein M8C21_021701 [Ambrosia artemisiifolia]
MEAEKRSSKGGFLQLFDWNGKSRKKLFLNKSDVPESSKQGKENVDSLAISRLQQMRLDESVHGPSLTGNDWASSTSNDEGSGSKAPGVVARLMGLDSLPTLDASDPGFTPLTYPHSFRHSLRPGITAESETVADYGMRNKLDGFSRNPFEDRFQKFQNRAIEKFQAEVLPPKSAKSVPSTHHRMLSPIKSPGFILTRNAASVMEEASKIIEQSPQSILNRRLPSSGSSSVPLRIRDLKEKMEAAHRTSCLPEASQRPKTYTPVNSTKRPCRTEIVVLKHDAAGSLKNKNKSTAPGKANIQISEGSTSRNSRSSVKQKEDDVKSVQSDKKQSTPKRVQSRSTKGKTPEVLKQNNQKQNTASHKDRTNLKPRVPYQHGRKTTATSGCCKEVNTSKKAVENSPRKARLVTSESSSTTKKFSGKRPTDGDIITNGSGTNNLMIKDKERSVKCNITIDGSSNWDSKIGMDVVSFTFTSPIKKAGSESESCGQSAVKSRCLFQENTETSPVIDGDALSVLLEQKLKELSSLVETSQCDMVKGSSASGDHMDKDKSIVQHDSDVSSVDQTLVNARMDWQGVEVTECSWIKHEHQHEHPCTSPSPEPSLSEDSCITSNSTTTLTSNGNSQYMSAARNMELWAEEIELQDCATSFPSTIFEFSFMARWSSERELEYIKELLNYAKLVLDDLAFDPTRNVISLDLFDELENQLKNIGPLSKQQRKALFDCVSVCLEGRRERGLSGSYEEWSKWSTMFQKKDLLADEIQKQIRGWRDMEELMVDEVVERDMSNGDGKWLDFKAEALEEGAVIGTDILTVLIDEIVVDFLAC